MSLLDKINKVASELSARHKYMRGDKGILEKSHYKLKNHNPETTMGKVGRVSGIAAIDLSWFLFCLAKFGLKDTKNGLNTILLDNFVIDRWKESKSKIQIDDNDSKFKQFFKNLQKTNPRVAATLQLWMVYTLMALSITGGVEIAEHKEDIQDKFKEWFSKKETKSDKYNPRDVNFTKNFINDNFDDIVIGLLEFETYRETPVLQSGEKRYTYGPGLTWVYVNGEQHPCSGEYKKMVENFSEAEVWDQVKQHCMYKTECLPLIKKSLIKNGFSEISKQQLLALLLAGYQLPSSIKEVIPRLKAAGNDEQKIMDAFIAGKEVKSKWREGTNKRRWWCAMLYTGKINIEDFLNMDRDAFSKVDINKIMKDGHFIANDEIIQYALQRKRQALGTVREFIILKGILDNIEILKIQQNKVIVFNDAVKKIKTKQTIKNTLSNFSNNDIYTV